MKIIDSVKRWVLESESIQKAQQLTQNPQNLVDWIESKNPGVAKKVLNVASEVRDPQLMGSGVHIQKLDDTNIVLDVPYRWKNHSMGRPMDSGVLVSIGEYACRQLWSRHITDTLVQFELKSFEGNLLSPIHQSVLCKTHLHPHEREQFLYGLYAKEAMDFAQEVSFFSHDELLLTQITFHFQFRGVKALSSGNNTAN
ncbi:MAG: hypothetical protein KDD61_16755 [Bdellovibrionales bacterium]|nr:hypothetical protein [Bdellovibrionales bacterium]